MLLMPAERLYAAKCVPGKCTTLHATAGTVHLQYKVVAELPDRIKLRLIREAVFRASSFQVPGWLPHCPRIREAGYALCTRTPLPGYHRYRGYAQQ